MCKRWKQSFIAFLNDMGNKPQHHALARKDNGQDFTPDNCYWRPKAFRPFEALYERAKKEIEKWHGHVRGLKFGLSYDEFIKFTETSACHYCGDVIHWVDNGRAPYNLDRKDNLKDYSTENCVVCCFECNATKGARFSYDEMLIVGKAVHEVKLGRLKNR
jgi:5-methylcytosine-specific restriction endonuclease McrA